MGRIDREPRHTEQRFDQFRAERPFGLPTIAPNGQVIMPGEEPQIRSGPVPGTSYRRKRSSGNHRR